jgi:FkbM family methyltransferase
LQGNSLALRISDPKDDNLIGKTPGIWLNPSSMISCDFEGRPFRQFIPTNISLFTCPVNSAEVIDPQMHGVSEPVMDEKVRQQGAQNMTDSELKNITDIVSNWRADINLPMPAQVILKNNNLISPEVIAELLVALVQSLSYEYFKDIICLVDVCEKALEKNPNAMMVSAFAAWSQGYTNECERWSKNLIAIAPNHPAGYLRLGLNFLTNQRFVEAFVSLSAGMRNANNDQSLIGWFLLAQRMASGPREVAFEKYGKRFRYRLSCFNTQAVESDAAHLGGRFTEEQELAFLAGALAGCKSFVEVGALVGNHTVFLASVFRPEKYLVVDADERSIAETTANVELNRENYPQTVFSFVESALAGSGGEEMQIGTKKVMTRTLAELLPDDVDFLKIDIDGMEGALLEPLVAFASDKDIRIFIEVETRFLSDYEKKMATIGYQIIHRTDHGSYLILLLRKVS